MKVSYSYDPTDGSHFVSLGYGFASVLKSISDDEWQPARIMRVNWVYADPRDARMMPEINQAANRIAAFLDERYQGEVGEHVETTVEELEALLDVS